VTALRTILDLCGGSGSWSAGYREARGGNGQPLYLVVVVDPFTPLEATENLVVIKRDVCEVQRSELPRTIHGVLAAPPCKDFSAAGARNWARKLISGQLEGSLAVVRACLRIVEEVAPAWWALENPPGRLPFLIGPPAYKFQPWWFGDPWTKLTYLWGRFRAPALGPLVVPAGGLTARVRSPAARARTPPGFSAAFFRANA
jgi:hypothetical protein